MKSDKKSSKSKNGQGSAPNAPSSLLVVSGSVLRPIKVCRATRRHRPCDLCGEIAIPGDNLCRDCAG